MKNFLLVAGLCLFGAGLWAYLSSKVKPPTAYLDEGPDTTLTQDSPSTELSWETYSWPPNLELPTGPTCDAMLERAGYTLCYADQHEQAYWVAYTLSLSELISKVKRKDNFSPDKDLITGSAQLADYRRSGYDRGHLAPAADMSWGAKAMDESFFMSNMSPQSPSFNRGMWNKLEAQVRKWAHTDTILHIVTGPVLRNGLPTIGANLGFPQIKAIAFIMPNKKLEGSIMDYALPIDSVELRTGIDFFHLLPEALEKRLEAHAEPSLWSIP
jgi:endonuclease G